jgi:hypothetical protein
MRRRSPAPETRGSARETERIADFDFVHLVPAGNQVFVTYEGRGTDGGRFRNTEILTVRRGQVAEVEVYFGWSIPHKAPAGGFLENGE